MPQIVYAMQFKGNASPVSESPPTFKAATTSPSCSITSQAGPDGLESNIQPVGSGGASFESQVTMTGDSSFDESGTITFGEGGNSLRFSTIGEGHIGPSPEPGVNHGAVMWRVDGGEGQFEGAMGMITSNFTFSEAGEIVDNQFGLIYLK
jgi:hypothetical protein